MRQGQILRRDHDLDERTRIRPGQSHVAAKFLDSLPHTADAHPDAVGPKLHYALFDALAIVADRDGQMNVHLGESDPTILRSRGAEDIVERLLNDPEGRGFHLGRKSGELSRLNIQKSFDAAALREPFPIPAKRR